MSLSELLSEREDEQEPRGTDICPQCGSGHTVSLRSSVYMVHPIRGLPDHCIYYGCHDCRSFWWVIGEVNDNGGQ